MAFEVGQNRSFIDIHLIDDTLPERQETLLVDLRSIIQGRSQLSNKTRLTVTIETSDNPNGLIGLFNVSNYVIQNPLSNRRLPFRVQRLAGNVGSIQVSKIFVFFRTKRCRILLVGLNFSSDIILSFTKCSRHHHPNKLQILA